MKTSPSISTAPKSSVEINPSDNEGHLALQLLELVSLRVAQIHQCSESIEIHKKRLKSLGETNGRLEELETWPTSTLFNDRDRAALKFCEKITLNPTQPVPAALIRRMRNYFTKEAIIRLTMMIMAVNDWNYMSMA